MASDELRAHAIAFIGRDLSSQKTDLADEFKSRLTNLWNHRLRLMKQDSVALANSQKELLAFAWWLYSEKFVPEWLLEQTREVLMLCTVVDDEFLFLKPFAHFSADHPIITAKCMLLLIEKLPSERSYILDSAEVREVIAAAYATKSRDGIELANTIRDLLLARGLFSFRTFGPT